MHKFLIDHIDPLGQGVYKQDDQVYFIPKTLPGEEGEFKVLKKKKGVHFCQLEKLVTSSDKRSEPACPHFNTCPGCHYLHTDYQNEISFKRDTFSRMLSKYVHPKIEVLKAPDRLGYRNRIQLHYSHEAIGFIDAKRNLITPVPHCKIFQPELQESFDWIQKNWQQERKKLKQPPKGHVEIYLKNDAPQVTWNKKYAEGGFSQVNKKLNSRVKQLVQELYPKISGGLLELFAGDGNLSQGLNFDRRVCLDIYSKTQPDQHSLDLFKQDSLEEFLNQYPQETFETLFLDPPRSGFKHLDLWVDHFKPKNIFYMSCHPATQVYDIRNISRQYQIKEVRLVDFFPGTYHFESIIAMQLK